MQITDKIIKPLTEVRYLNAENVDRYRCIMRIFYEKSEKLKYWLYQEEVYEEMMKQSYFEGYRPEQCQQDLTMLVEWKNLNTIQDTKNVATIEEFKNKKFRYQMSQYSVEIERLVVRLENLFIEGASLEPSLLERLRKNIERFSEMETQDEATVYTWWNDLNHDFIRLNQNYQDYMRDLNSVKAEKMMQTKEFLVFKDRLIEYLRSFIKGLQRNVGAIEEKLRALPEKTKENVFEKLICYEGAIPRMDVERSEEQIRQTVLGRYQSIFDWFVQAEGAETEAAKLFDATNEIIRRITRYAARISEKNAFGANRKEEYRKVAELFLRCEGLGQAHKMSAMVFGLERPYHMKEKEERKTDSMNSGVYEEKPQEWKLTPRIRTYKERTNRSAIREMTSEKAEARRQFMEEQAAQVQKLQSLEQNGKIDFSALPIVEPKIREVLLNWLTDALEDADMAGRTEDGRAFKLDISCAKERCTLRCTDGDLTMPSYQIIFLETE